MRPCWELAVLAVAACLCAVPGAHGAPGPPETAVAADQLAMEARDSELELEPEPENAALLAPGQAAPPVILNGGKPFFADKDPVTGKLDLSATKAEPAQPLLEAVADYDYEEHDGIDRKDTAGTRGRPNDLQGALKIVTPNFHDFLNLPVKYSSAGDKYPLISSSYANTKVQGMGAQAAQSAANNVPSGSIKNHKPTYTASSAPAPHYYTLPASTSTTTTTTTTTTTPVPVTRATTTTTTSTTTPRPSRPPATTTTSKPSVSSFWGLLSGESEEYPDQAPQGSFGMKPPRVPSSEEERPVVDYEYSYEDDSPLVGPPVNSHQPPLPALQATPSTTSSASSSTSTTTTTTSTTTTTTAAPTSTSAPSTVRPTTRRPQLSTVMIMKPTRKPVVVTARPAEPSTTTTTTTTTKATPTTPSTTVTATAPTTSSAAPTPSSNVLLVPEQAGAASGTSNKVVFEAAPSAQPGPQGHPGAPLDVAPRPPPPQRPNLPNLAFRPPHPPQYPYQGPPTGPPRDSPYGVAPNLPFRPLYDRRPPPPPPAPSGPSGYGDLITAPVAGEGGADNDYVSFSFQPPTPQQMRPPAPPPGPPPGPPRYPGVEPPRPNPPTAFRQPPPPPAAAPKPPARPAPVTPEPERQEISEQQPQPSPPPQQPEQQQTTKAPAVPSTTNRVVFPDEKQDTKEIVVHGSFQHPTQSGPPHRGPGQGLGQVLDAPPPFRRPAPTVQGQGQLQGQGQGLQSPNRHPAQPQVGLDSEREGSEQQPAYELPPVQGPAQPAQPAQPATDLMPPADPGKTRVPLGPQADWPRPHWETMQGHHGGHHGGHGHARPPYQGPQGLRQKVDVLPPHAQHVGHHHHHHPRPPGPGPQGPQGGMPVVPHGYKKKPDAGLPNILPQFRPNARLSGVQPEQQGVIGQGLGQGRPGQPQRMPLMERPGEGHPHSVLPLAAVPPGAPPAVPPGQQHLPPLLRVNRHNSEEAVAAAAAPRTPPTSLSEVEQVIGNLMGLDSPPSAEGPVPHTAHGRLPLHRRAGPPQGPPMGPPLGPPLVLSRGHEPRRRVSTLQMMQQHGVGPTHRVLSRADLPADRAPGHGPLAPPAPVFLVYPVNAHARPAGPADEAALEAAPNAIKLDDLLDEEPLYGVPTRDRGDDPVLKPSKAQRQPARQPPRQPPKADFPYAIEQTSSTTRQPPALGAVPVADKRRDDAADPHDDSEVNVIPYLQDYLPFATKRPPPAAAPRPPPRPSVASTAPSTVVPSRIVLGSGTSAPPTSLQPISATLKTVTASSAALGPPSRHETVIGGASGGSEFTVGAVMHTLSNHRLPEGGLPGGSSSDHDDNGFQAPFQASVSVGSVSGPSSSGATSAGIGSSGDGAPAGAGWSVLSGSGPASSMRPGTVDKADIRDIIKESASSASPSETTFDFENFKPQLFGGFKPILPDESAPTAPAPTPAAPSAAPEREERKITPVT